MSIDRVRPYLAERGMEARIKELEKLNVNEYDSVWDYAHIGYDVYEEGLQNGYFCKKEDGTEGVELLEAPWAKPGTRIVLEGDDLNAEKPAEIQADVFFQIEINVKEKNVEIGGKKLTADGKVLTTEKTINGPVN